MEKEQNNNIPKLGDKGVFEVTEESNLRAEENFKGRGKTSYKDIDIESAYLPEDEKEWGSMLAEERKLRETLRRIDTWEKTPQEVAQLVSNANLVDNLLEWARVHMRNRASQMKKGNSDILIVPMSQTLLEAAKIIEETK